MTQRRRIISHHDRVTRTGTFRSNGRTVVVGDMGETEQEPKNDASSYNRNNKRKRWEAKQARKSEQQAKEADRNSWIQSCKYCTKVSMEVVKEAREELPGKTSSETLANPLVKMLQPYLDLKDGPPKSVAVSDEKLFIAEGTETVRLLVQQCSKDQPIKVISILVKPATLFDDPVNLLNDVQQLVGKEGDTADSPFHVLVGSEDSLSAVAGFHISRGALACGVVPQRDESWLDAFITSKIRQLHDCGTLRILALDGISDTANLGSMIRCAAAFGIDVMVLSNDCCDAWYRRSVRVSMGHVFSVPIVRVNDLASTISRLASGPQGIPSYAAVIDPGSDLVLERIGRGEIPRAWCCVMGNEGNGISDIVSKACTNRLRIDMVSGVDSLSVPIATGILLHGLKEREATSIN